MRSSPAAMTISNPLDADSEQMRLALELSGTGLWSWDLESGEVLLSWKCCPIARCTQLVACAQAFLDMVHMQDRDELQQALSLAAETGQTLAHEFRFVGADGVVVPVAMRGRRVPARAQRPAKLYGTLAEAAHEPQGQATQPDTSECELARAALSGLPTAAVFVVDRQLRYVLADGQALQAAGMDRSHLEGRTLAEVVPAEMLEDCEADYRSALDGQSFKREHRVAEQHFITHGVPLRNRDQTVYAALAFSFDITELKQAQEALQRSEALLSAVLDALPIGVVIADADGRIVRDNAANRQLRGVPAETTSSQQHGERHCYWPGTGRPIQAHESAMARALHAGERTTGELIECVPFGSSQRRLYLNNAAPIRNAAGRITAAVVAELDVTQRMAVEQALRERERELRTLADNVPALIAHVGPELRYQFVNRPYADWFGLEPDAIVGRHMSEILPHEHYAGILPRLRQVLAGETVGFDMDVLRRDGQLRHMHAIYVPDTPPPRDARGRSQYAGFLLMVHDLTEKTQMARMLQERALTDELTGLPNRAAWNAEVQRGVARAHRAGLPATVMFLDLDGFKQVNDTWGHAAGDVLLCEFAHRLRGCLRRSDFIARLAGDEFVVLLDRLSQPSVDPAVVAGKILAAMGPLVYLDGHALKIRPSIGIAVQHGPLLDATRLMLKADEAMYLAKRGGKGQFVVLEC